MEGHPTNFAFHPSLLKSSLHARFDPRLGPKHTVFGFYWSFWSPIRSHFQLSADFFNRLTPSAKFRTRLRHLYQNRARHLTCHAWVPT
jgi:hypothetical protein